MKPALLALVVVLLAGCGARTFPERLAAAGISGATTGRIVFCGTEADVG